MKAMLSTLVIAVFLLVAQRGVAQEQEQSRYPKLAELPKNVRYTAGEFSIFANFENQEDGQLLIFIVNDSDKDVTLPSQDGDVYLKQEAKVNGEWVRSQPHLYSWCGNSYMEMPTIPSGHFSIQPSLFFGWVPPVTAPEGENPNMLPVRYRFYTDQNFDVISNEGESRVSPKLLERAKYDSLAMKFAGVERLVEVAKGEVGMISLDHTDPQIMAVQQLARFPGNKEAQETIREIVDWVSGMTADEVKEDRSVERMLDCALRASVTTHGMEDSWKLHLGVVIDDKSLFRGDALNWLVKNFEKGTRVPEKTAVLDQILTSWDHPLYYTALGLRSEFWPDEERRVKLRALMANEDAPEAVRERALELYYRHFSNPFIQLWADYSFETGLRDVKIENVSDKALVLTYSHPFDLISSKVWIWDWELSAEDNEIAVPLREDFETVLKAERHPEKKKKLEPGETLNFPEFNIWRYYAIPESLPKDFSYRIYCDLAQFGDIPTPSGGWSTYETNDDTKLAVLKAARAEQQLASRSRK